MLATGVGGWEADRRNLGPGLRRGYHVVNLSLGREWFDAVLQVDECHACVAYHGRRASFLRHRSADFAEISLRIGVAPTSRTRRTGLPASYSRS